MKDLICTFFGHRDCSEKIIPQIYDAIEQIIVKSGCRVFYVGNHGNFDRFVSKVLEDLKKIYDIKVYIVLAYVPTNKDLCYKHDTIVPDGIERVPKRFAIIYRNRWMVEKSDVVLTYVKKQFWRCCTI